jgi:hypothetical protein
MCDSVHTTGLFLFGGPSLMWRSRAPSTTTYPRRNQWSRRRTFATQSYSATPRVGQGRRCRRGPRTHVWGRHVDCVGRLRVQVPRPTDDAQVKRRTRQTPQNGSSLVRPLAPTKSHSGVGGGREPWSNPHGSFFQRSPATRQGPQNQTKQISVPPLTATQTGGQSPGRADPQPPGLFYLQCKANSRLLAVQAATNVLGRRSNSNFMHALHGNKGPR